MRRNQGAPGVDGVSIEQMAATPESEAAFLAELQRSLKERTYRTQAVRRVYLPKPNGKLRPLAQHLKRRGQRGWNAPDNENPYHYFARMGLLTL